MNNKVNNRQYLLLNLILLVPMAVLAFLLAYLLKVLADRYLGVDPYYWHVLLAVLVIMEVGYLYFVNHDKNLEEKRAFVSRKQRESKEREDQLQRARLLGKINNLFKIKQESERLEVIHNHINKYLDQKDKPFFNDILFFCWKNLGNFRTYSKYSAIVRVQNDVYFVNVVLLDRIMRARDFYENMSKSLKSPYLRVNNAVELDEKLRLIRRCENIQIFITEFYTQLRLIRQQVRLISDYDLMIDICNEIVRRIQPEDEEQDIKLYRALRLRLKGNLTDATILKVLMGTPIKKKLDDTLFGQITDRFSMNTKLTNLMNLIETVDREVEPAINAGDTTAQRVSSADEIATLEGYMFMVFLEDLFKRLGFNVSQTPEYGDKGADFIVSKEKQRLVVQTKKAHRHVGGSIDFSSIIAAGNYYGAQKAIIVTTGIFTDKEIDAAVKQGVELWDLTKIQQMAVKADAFSDVSGPESIFETNGATSKVKANCLYCTQLINYEISLAEVEKGLYFIETCPHCSMSLKS